ncbi:MAG: hypothetical protein IKC74_04175, partial [Clostridia bacterium]|nr:hypothetical protein [Clostridia bacterium]
MNDSKFLSLNGLIYYDEKLKSRIKELYGSDMTVEWQEIKDGKNPFKLKIALKNGNGTELFAKTVDFPLEQTIVSGSYENSTKSLILYFQDGTSTKIPIKDLIEGLASKLDLDKKANLGVKTRDSNTAHIRDIPENALPYAGISKIGGMSYKSQNLVKQPYSFGSQTIQGVTITVNSDNSITFNGTSTGDIALNMGQVYLRKDVSYTINGIKNLTEAQALFYVKTGGFFDKLLINSNGAVTKTCLKDGEAALELYIYRGTTIKQTVYPMFNEGSTSLPYEPYFEGLRHAKGTAAKSVGANLFDTNSLIPRTYIDLNSGNLVEESVDGWYCTQPIEVKDSVTISGIVNTTNGAVRYRTLNTSGSVVSVADIGLFTKKTITLSSDEKFLQICLRSNNLKTCNINHGTEALPYSPYFEHTIAIPEAVQNEEWYGIGIPNTEYYNSIDLENGKGDIKAKKIVLNGTENFLISKL